VLLDFAPELRDQLLALQSKATGEGERGDALDGRGGDDRQHQREQERGLVFADDVIDEIAGGSGRTSPRRG